MKIATPSIGIVSAPQPWTSLDGQEFGAEAADLMVRMISSNQPHRALPLTASLCVAVAANVPDTLVHAVARYPGNGPLRLGMPSGVLAVSAEVRKDRDGWYAAVRQFLPDRAAAVRRPRLPAQLGSVLVYATRCGCAQERPRAPPIFNCTTHGMSFKEISGAAQPSKPASANSRMRTTVSRSAPS